MIALKNLSLKYGDKTVLMHINQAFESRQIHGIVGLNGAGKTSLFNVLAQVISASSGEILFNEKPLSYKHISLLETEPFFYSRLTGQEFLNIFPKNNPDFKEAEMNALLKVPLHELIENYSTGERKKLALLAILKENREIVILDEPFNGLDLESAKILEVIIHRLKEKQKTVLISSHILSPLYSLCDKIHHLVEGRFLKTYLPSEFADLEAGVFGDLRTTAEEKVLGFM